MTQKSINRRNVIAAGVAGLSLGLLSIAPVNAQQTEDSDKPKLKRSSRTSRRKKEEETAWKYIPMTEEQITAAGQAAYEAYHTHGCMFAVVKSGILAYAQAIESTNPEQAQICRQFPFNAFKYGRTGYGGQESMCGAVNGAGFFMSLFVENPNDLNGLLKKVSLYVKETPQPVFAPADDKHPNFVQAVSHSIICKDNTTAWLAKDPSEAHRLLRSERCMRYSASVLMFALNTLNDFFKEA